MSERQNEQRRKWREATAKYKAANLNEVRLRQRERYWKEHNKLRAQAREIYRKNPRKYRLFFTPDQKSINLEKVYRIGKCSLCGKSIEDGTIPFTQLHHLKYDRTDPVAHTIEVCVSCHMKIERNRNAETYAIV